MKSKALFFLVPALALILQACGGGGGGGGGGTALAPPGQMPNSYQQRVAVREAARVAPNFGSVVQSSNFNSRSRITVDTVEATLNARNEPTVTITQGNGGGRLVFGPGAPRAPADSTFTASEPLTRSDITGYAPSNYDSGRSYTYASASDSRSTSFQLDAIAAIWDSSDPRDTYLVYGIWMNANDNPFNPNTSFYAGAFVDGPELDSSVRAPTIPPTGFANYQGRATWIGVVEYKPTSEYADVAEFHEGEGVMTARADFANNEIFLCLGCEGRLRGYGVAVNNVTGQFVSASYESDFEFSATATIESDGQFRTRNTNLVNNEQGGDPIISHSGSIGGVFSNINNASGNPRGIAGTHGGVYETIDAEASWLGVFGAFER